MKFHMYHKKTCNSHMLKRNASLPPKSTTFGQLAYVAIFFFFFFLKFGDVLCEGKISAGFSIFIFQKKSKKKEKKCHICKGW